MKETICLETVDIQTDRLTELCGQRESGTWLGRCDLRRQTDRDFNSGSMVYICVNLDESQNFLETVTSLRRKITLSILIPWHTQFVKEPGNLDPFDPMPLFTFRI